MLDNHTPSYRDLRLRLRILTQRGNHNRKMILGHTVLAFQISVPAGGFSLKIKNQRNTLRSRLRILCKRRKKEKQRTWGTSLWRFKLAFPLGDSQQKYDKQQKTDSEAQGKQNKNTHRSAATDVFFEKKTPVVAERWPPPP